MGLSKAPSAVFYAQDALVDYDTNGNWTGKVVVVGTFSSYNGTAADDVVRLDATTGAIDPTFTGPTGTLDLHKVVQEYSSATQKPTGKYFVGGWLFTVDANAGTPDHMVRLNSDGTLDTGYNIGNAGFSTEVREIVNERDTNGDYTGRVLVAGYFTTYNGADVPDGIVMLDAAGAHDTTFNNTGSGADTAQVNSVKQELNTSTGLPTGKWIVGGENIHTYNTVDVPDELIRLNANGTWDATFATATTGLNHRIYDMAFLRDSSGDLSGDILVGGWLTMSNGVGQSISNLFRMTGSGDYDGTFNSGGDGTAYTGEFYPLVYSVANARDSDGNYNGKAYVGGYFQHYNGKLRPHFLRINADGTVDEQFEGDWR